MLKYIKEVIYMNELVLKILDYIDNNLYKKITMDELSRVFFFNKDYIMRTFKKELRMTIIDYINRKRIYNSLEELKTTDDMMLKVALKHGYVSQEYFSEIFSKYMGVNPLTYRKFTKVNTTISYEDISLIRKNLVELKYQLDKIEKYRNNIEQENTKVLSRF